MEFGDKVLSGVKLSQSNGTYMKKTKVPLNGSSIAMPSVNNWSAYMDQFVSGGKLLSGETEVTLKPLHNIIGAASNISSEEISGEIDGIQYLVKQL